VAAAGIGRRWIAYPYGDVAAVVRPAAAVADAAAASLGMAA